MRDSLRAVQREPGKLYLMHCTVHRQPRLRLVRSNIPARSGLGQVRRPRLERSRRAHRSDTNNHHQQQRATAATTMTASTTITTTAAATTAAMKHRRARNAGAAQAFAAVALCIVWLDAGTLTALLVPAGIALVLSNPTNIARRASVNWWICTVTALITALDLAFLWFISSGALASLVTTRDAEGFCRIIARAARPGPQQIWVPQSNCDMFVQLRQLDELFNPPERLDSRGSPAPAPAVTQSMKAAAGSADANCRADCMVAWRFVTDESSIFLQIIEGDATALPSGCVYVAFLVACAFISSSASSAGEPGVIEPQDLPDHRMAPTAAIVHGVRKTFTTVGRASRSEYWSYVVFVAAMLFGSAALHESLAEANTSVSTWIPAAVGYNGTAHPDLMGAEFVKFFSICSTCLQVLLPMALLLSFLFATVRRLHDTGRSARRLVLAALLPPVGLLVVFWLLRGSEPRRNTFGSVPMNGSWQSEELSDAEAEVSTGIPPVEEPDALQESWISAMDAVASGVSRSYTKAGRASRSEYWWYMLFGPGMLIVLAALGESEPVREIRHAQMPPVFDEMALKPLSDRQKPMRVLQSMLALDALVAVVFVTTVLTSFLFATVRRLHDTGRSGWRLLLVPMPFGVLFVVFWLMSGSELRRNSFGSVPTNGSWREYDAAVLRSTSSNLNEKNPTSDDNDALREDAAEAKEEDSENPLQRVAVEVGREDLPEHLRHAVD